MAQNSHYMASFLHFRAILATLLAVRATFMVTLGIGRTQALATHVGRWCEAIFALSGYLYGAGVVQNMAIFGVKIRHLWLASSRVKIPPGNGFMCHITPQCIEQHYLGPLLPSPGTHPGFQGSKIWLFLGQNPATMAGCLQIVPSCLESVWCAILHPNACNNIT